MAALTLENPVKKTETQGNLSTTIYPKNKAAKQLEKKHVKDYPIWVINVLLLYGYRYFGFAMGNLRNVFIADVILWIFWRM